MRISCNVATFSKRENTLYRTLPYLLNQTTPFDVIRIYANDYEPDINDPRIEVYTGGEDITDRGKFYFYEGLDEPEAYFSWDDDLVMPPDYVEKTLEYLDQHEGIITYHGRKLQGKGLHYYRDHETHHFRWQMGEDVKVDIPGTGCLAFHTDTFTPNVLEYEHDKMVDVLIGLEAAKQNVLIWCCKHKNNWIESVNTTTAIYSEMRNDCKVQSKLCDRVYQLRNQD